VTLRRRIRNPSPDLTHAPGCKHPRLRVLNQFHSRAILVPGRNSPYPLVMRPRASLNMAALLGNQTAASHPKGECTRTTIPGFSPHVCTYSHFKLHFEIRPWLTSRWEDSQLELSRSVLQDKVSCREITALCTKSWNYEEQRDRGE
jgi:hypothetical protein